MSWILARLVKASLFFMAGLLIGGGLGQFVGLPWAGSIVGALIAWLVAVGADALRARRHLEWLRTPTAEPPADDGLWAELSHRVGRALAERDARAAQERQRREQLLAGIEASPNGVLLLGTDAEIEWGNRTAAEHFGLDLVRDYKQRVTHLVRSPVFVSYLQHRQFGQPCTALAPDGRTMLSIYVREFGGGMLLVLSQDITERERTEAMRRDFVANVSHEIRTPLTVLAGFVETLGTLSLSPAERKRVLTLMEQQTDRMQHLIADLLALAQLEGSPRPGIEQWLPIAPLLARAEADGRALSAGRHKFRLESTDDIEVAGSAAELQSAIGNLVSNAVRYTPEGGTIAILWRGRADGSGTIEVSDTGIGIAKEHVPRLTERFYRVDGSRSRDTGGTGLGLSIVKHVMQRHGGSLEVESEVGAGSHFRLVLPPQRLRPVKAPASDWPAAAPQ